MENKKIMFVATGGGHLTELLALSEQIDRTKNDIFCISTVKISTINNSIKAPDFNLMKPWTLLISFLLHFIY